MKSLCCQLKGERYNISCIEYEPETCTADFSVVCLHGFGGDKKSSAIKMLAERITEAGGAVVAFDFASHGESEVGEEMLTIKNCISDAKAVYTYAENKYGRADFFATSFGAFVLVNMLKGTEYKGARAVLRSPAVKMGDTFLNPICKLSIDELKKAESVECGFERKMKLGYSFWQDLEKHIVDDAGFDNQCLMIYGDRDDVVKPSDMAAFALARENIEVAVIKGADHRFKGKGQLEGVIEASVKFFLG